MKYLHATAAYPCPRAGKMALAIPGQHVSVSRKPPAHFPEAWERNIFGPFLDIGDAVAHTEHDVVFAHLEIGQAWACVAAMENTDKPKVLVIHDNITSMGMFDPDEERAFDLADLYLWVSEGQRADHPLARDTGNYYLPNGPSSTMFIEKTPLPHIGGLVYGGGVHARGHAEKWRDISAVADVCDLHIFPANEGCDYGIIHQPEVSNHLLIHRFAQFDWGFSGTVYPNHIWEYNSPNKLGEYLAAGIPFIALNSPAALPMAEAGLGICTNRLSEIPSLLKMDPRALRKPIMEQRHDYSMERLIRPLLEVLT